jgi:hypothetical protein
VYAVHVRQLKGESPFHVLMEEMVIAKRKGVVTRRDLKEAWSKSLSEYLSSRD